jgi:thiamine pyrophosphate-dependent acetolactate synthase large subunit-like protein
MNQTLPRAVSVSDYLLHSVSGWGTRVVFGVPGPTTSELLAALERTYDRDMASSLGFIVARHESGAAFMADG